MKQQELTAAQERALRRAISSDYLAEETGHVRRLARTAKLLPAQRRQVETVAREMIDRRASPPQGGFAFWYRAGDGAGGSGCFGT